MSEELDELRKDNQEAEYNLNPKQSQAEFQNFTQYGEYDLVPISEQKKNELNESLQHLHEVIKPTFMQLKKKQNLQEIQDRIFRPLNREIGIFTTCLVNARDRTDSDQCADQLAKYIREDSVNYALKIMKEY